MEALRKLFKDKDKPFPVRIALIAVLGILLLVSSGLFFKGKENYPQAFKETEAETAGGKTMPVKSYESELEERLSALLSKVEGAGKVEVMITLSYGSEIIIAEDISSNETLMREADSSGGSRENRTKVTENNKIIIQSANGVQQPLVVKEIVPKVEGVVIVAQGGSDILIKEALINAVKTVLGVEIHKVQVLKMKE